MNHPLSNPFRRIVRSAGGAVLGLAALGLAGCVSSGADLRDLRMEINAIKLDQAKQNVEQRDAMLKIEHALNQLQQSADVHKEALDALREDLEKNRGPRTARTPVAPGTALTDPAAASAAAEAQMLADAQEQYTAGAYERCIEIGANFLRQFPDSPKGADAALSMASAQYKIKSYDKALATLDMILEKYPTTPKMPQVLHSKALCEIQTAQRSAAARTIERLQAQFPTYEPETIKSIYERHVKQP